MSELLRLLLAGISALMVGFDGVDDPVVVTARGDAPVTVRAMMDMPNSLNERVDVDIKDQSVRDALKAVLEPAKIPFTVDDDVPSDVRITVSAKGVRLRSVLDLIADAAGVGWQRELGSGKVTLRFSKAIRTWFGSRLGVSVPIPEKLEGLHEMLVDPLREGFVWRAYLGNEERSSITCPHCKSEITRVAKPSADKCPKCGTEFKPGWKVCPFDGTKRPQSGPEWKYCPVCGKSLSGGK